MAVYTLWRGIPTLAFLNVPSNSLQFYNYKSGQLIERISFPDLEQYGANRIEGFLTVSPDSLLLFTSSKVLLADDKANIRQSWNLYNGGAAPEPSISSDAPPILHRGRLYVGGIALGNSNYKPFREVNLSDGTYKLIFGISPRYLEGFWGGHSFDYIYHCFNPEKKKFIFSFPPDDNVYITDFIQTDTIWAGSELFANIPPPYRDQAQVAAKNPEEYTADFYGSNSYFSIHYDPYRKLYYRLNLLAISTDDLKSQEPERASDQQFSVSVFDSAFHKLAETTLPRFKYHLRVVVSPDGLLVPVNDPKREDFLTYQVFTLKSKQNE
jgi:hypothetical protein